MVTSTQQTTANPSKDSSRKLEELNREIAKVRDGSNLLSRGKRGDVVSNYQDRLDELNWCKQFLPGKTIKIDGKYGQQTFEAVKEFQKQSNLKKVDGIIGPETHDAMEKALNELGIDGLVLPPVKTPSEAQSKEDTEKAAKGEKTKPGPLISRNVPQPSSREFEPEVPTGKETCMQLANKQLNNELGLILNKQARIKKEAIGMDVALVQHSLNALNASDIASGKVAAINIDGVAGDKTDTAIRAFQKSQNLSADGVVGSDTLTALSDALAKQKQEASGKDASTAEIEKTSLDPKAKAAKLIEDSGFVPSQELVETLNPNGCGIYNVYGVGYNRGKPYNVELASFRMQGSNVTLEREAAYKFVNFLNYANQCGIDPTSFRITESFRTFEQQNELYYGDPAKTGRTGPAALPGYSNHQQGLSIDMSRGSAGFDFWRKNCKSFGFKPSSEGWHFTYQKRSGNIIADTAKGLFNIVCPGWEKD